MAFPNPLIGPPMVGPQTTPSPDPSLSSQPDPTQGMGSTMPPQAPAINPQAPAATAQDAQVAHHAALGKIAKFIMGNQTEFQPQPDGSVKQVDVPQKPGQLFRGMLLAGILGAGTQAHGFGEGFAQGAAGAGERAVQARQQVRNEAVQDQQMRQKQQEEEDKHQHYSDEHKEAIARTASLTVQTAHLQHTLDNLPLENMEKVNNAAQATLSAAYGAGGRDAQVIVDGKDINGQLGNSEAWRDALAKNPKLATAPDQNHVRVFTTANTQPPNAEIKDGEWVDKVSGQRLDMHKYSTIRAVDIPIDTLTQMHEMTGAEFNKMAGSNVYDSNQKVNASVADILKVQHAVGADALQAAKVKYDEAQATKQYELAKRAQNQLEKNGRTATVTAYNDALKSLDAQLKQEQSAVTPDQNKIATLQAQISELNNRLIGEAAASEPEIKFNPTQQKQIATLPKPTGAGAVMPLAVMKQYIAMFPNDPTGSMAHQAALQNGWTSFETPQAPQQTPQQPAAAPQQAAPPSPVVTTSQQERFGNQ